MDLWIRFHDFVNEYEDSVAGQWFLMSSPVPLFIITGCYLYIINVLLPAYMKNRRRFEFPRFLIIYNVLQVSLSVWLFHGLFLGGVDSLNCYPEGRSFTYPFIPKYTYYFHLSKYTDLLDSVLILLRKKTNQLSFLHVYHHSTMPFWTWMSVKYSRDGRLTFLAYLNSFVHVTMYTYYLLSALGPTIRKYLWWKKYVTLIQMTQFILVLLHTTQSAIYGCNVPRFLSLFNGIQSAVYLMLFLNYYQKTYKKKEIIGDFKEVDNGMKEKCD